MTRMVIDAAATILQFVVFLAVFFVCVAVLTGAIALVSWIAG